MSKSATELDLTLLFRNKTVTLRTHDWGGAILNQVTADAAAAYGDLVISAKLVAICISSGREADPELYLAGNPRAAYRMDFGDFRSSAEIACGVLTGDQILVWNSETGVVRVVSIPQSEEAPLTVSIFPSSVTKTTTDQMITSISMMLLFKFVMAISP